MSPIEKLNNAITQWAYGKEKLLVAVDGYTGIGKTTLADNLAVMNPDIIIVHRDDFLFSRKTVEDKLSRVADRSKVFELKVCDDNKLRELISAFRKDEKVHQIHTFNPISGEIDILKTFDLSKRIMVIEGVFMFHPRLLNDLWDKRVYLAGDMNNINARRIAREQEKWGSDYFPETHPDSYFRQVTTALQRYIKQYQPEETADLVLRVD